jgi:hypothetical protein
VESLPQSLSVGEACTELAAPVESVGKGSTDAVFY